MTLPTSSSRSGRRGNPHVNDIVPRRCEVFPGPVPDASYRAAASHRRIHDRRFDAFMGDDPVGVDEVGANILGLEPVVSLEDRLRRIAGGEHAEDVLDGETPSPNDRLAAEDLRTDGDALEEIGVVHGSAFRESRAGLSYACARSDLPFVPTGTNRPRPKWQGVQNESSPMPNSPCTPRAPHRRAARGLARPRATP